ncbi:hypothetical protein FOBRF1_007096 [Fusarium oxysporum]
MKRPFESTQTDHVAAAEQSETTPWLQNTRLAELFRSRPLDIIAASAQQPVLQRSGSYLLGQWQGVPLWSSAGTEAQLRIILQGLDFMFDRAIATLDRTPYTSLLAEHIFKRCILAAQISGHTKLQEISGDMENIHLLRLSRSAVPGAATPGGI